MELKEFIEKNGKENCLFLLPMKEIRTFLGFIKYRSSSDPDIIVPCKINEDEYKISDNYKITLKSIYPQFGKEHFYISDLENMIKNGDVELYVKA